MKKIVKMIYFLAIFFIVSTVISAMFGYSGLKTGNQIEKITIKGMITMEQSSQFLRPSISAETIIKKLEEAEKSDNVKAIILDINSGGGSVVGSKIIAEKVQNLEKPVISLIGESALSGAYWIASASDYIISDDLSFVGSIGVIGSYLEFSNLIENYDITYQRLVSSEFKDIGSPFKSMTTEEKDLIQSRIDSVHDFMVESIAINRNVSIKDMQDLSDGIFYLGKDSIEIGLVDELGNEKTAFNKSLELANIEDAQIRETKEKKSLLSYFVQYTSESWYFLGRGIGSELKIKPESFNTGIKLK